MKRELVVCNLCNGSGDSGLGIVIGLVKDDYGAHADEYRRVASKDSDIHLCAECSAALRLMYLNSPQPPDVAQD